MHRIIWGRRVNGAPERTICLLIAIFTYANPDRRGESPWGTEASMCSRMPDKKMVVYYMGVNYFFFQRFSWWFV